MGGIFTWSLIWYIQPTVSVNINPNNEPLDNKIHKHRQVLHSMDSKINEYVEDARPEDPRAQCRHATYNLTSTLDENGIENKLCKGAFCGHDAGGAGKARHWFVTVSPELLESYSGSERVILDPTHNQFTSENYYSDSARACVPDSAVIQRGIIYATDDIYDAYRGIR